MSRHPAPDELLLDYATGVLPEGPALAVALKLALDPEARRTVDRLRALGGALLETEEAVGDVDLEGALARLDGVAVGPRPAPPMPQQGQAWAPAPLRSYIVGKDWKRAFGGFERIELALHGDTHRVALLRLEPGKGLPLHKHVANEYTVVLQGGYTDNTGSYAVGDFAVGPGPQEHEPIADPGEPCIALIVVEKPIVLTSKLGRWLNPLLRWGWM
ncbi:MAG TPA: ChrR family anti-sigma-E factor [Reyranella sp.]|nr:ChrR family anti-sigma-E factor [Reyranella sp.]